jgi:hypothetical protein
VALSFSVLGFSAEAGKNWGTGWDCIVIAALLLALLAWRSTSETSAALALPPFKVGVLLCTFTVPRALLNRGSLEGDAVRGIGGEDPTK